MIEKINDHLLSWAVDLEQQAKEQAERTSRLPIVEGHIALMPDAHWGMGSTVGSVIATRGAVIPAAVGVDIGCGMIGVLTRLTSKHLPEQLDDYLPQAARDVPAGVGQGHSKELPGWVKWIRENPVPTELSEKQWGTAMLQFGSLGSGNHFYEVCLDEQDRVWLVLHSGSRGIGNQLAQVHINKARQLFAEAGAVLEDKDLAYFVQGTPEFQAYIADMLWSQSYAFASRQAMMENALRGFLHYVGASGRALNQPMAQVVNCHHNYCVMEDDLWITRKGAISAREGELGIVPGSMGTNTYIVQGKGNPLSFYSSSHGAGRRMSRGQARREVPIADFRAAMGTRAWQESDADSLVDESPQAYKDIESVMAAQSDLTEPIHTLHAVVNYKGVDRHGHKH